MPNADFNMPRGRQAHSKTDQGNREKDLKENRDWWQPGIHERPRTHFCSWGMANCEAELGGTQARGKSDDLRDPQGR